MSNAAIDSANRYHSFMRGFRHGSGGKAPDKRHLDHVTLRTPYLEGFDMGQFAYGSAMKTAIAAFGFTPSVLRDEEEPQLVRDLLPRRPVLEGSSEREG